MNALTAYFRESIEELRQVRWPTRQQAIRLSAVVIIFTGVCAAFFGLVDFGLSEIIQFLLSFSS